MLNDLTPPQRLLAEYLSDLSEEAYCAGWMLGLEYDLWECLTTSRKNYGMIEITEANKERLRDLSDACHGWIVFDAEKEETFVPTHEWIDLYAERNR
jgi:hypothetical protein